MHEHVNFFCPEALRHLAAFDALGDCCRKDEMKHQFIQIRNLQSHFKDDDLC